MRSVDSPACARRVLDDVGERLGDREVGRRLDRRRQPARRASACTSTGSGAASASACTAPTSPRSASTGGWMPRTRSRSSASASLLAAARLGEQRPRAVGVVGELLLGQGQAHAQRDQPGLRAVVQVALDAAQLGGLGVDGLGARLGQLLHAQRQPALLRHRRAARGRARRAARRDHRRQPPEDQVEHVLDDGDDRAARGRPCRRPAARPRRGAAAGSARQRAEPDQQVAARARAGRATRSRLAAQRADHAPAVLAPAGATSRERHDQHRDADPHGDQRGAVTVSDEQHEADAGQQHGSARAHHSIAQPRRRTRSPRASS